MPRWLAFLMFFSIALLILSGIHFYFYRRLVIATALPAPFSTAIRVAFIVLLASFPLSFFVVRHLSIAVGSIVLHPIYIWLGFMLLLLCLLVLLDLGQGLAWVGARLAGRRQLIDDPGRRLLLARVLAVVAVSGALVSSGVALWRGLRLPVVKRIDVVLPRLPAAFDGFTIVQLTDLHLGAMRSGRWVAEVVAEVNRLQPDAIAITGDLADATPAQLADDVLALARLHAPQGVYFVTGNHEYFIDLEVWLTRLREIGFRVLRNERVRLTRGEAALYLAGVDDHEGQRLAAGHGPDLAAAMTGRDPALATVLLAHQPRIITQAAPLGIDLVLTGHTHGGQIWPWNYVVYLQQPLVSGLHQRNGTQIYVSDGTGFWGPPMRLGSTAEITYITLRAAAHAREGAGAT